ncbi:hypothetical protein GQ44DRAFT_17050 [Phaeosphaeriaceae sp. PMI808]|nr:hypothetical protein GQ44DRAFT_17050 [Phaeosphaeriaceae sp. PMI808]
MDATASVVPGTTVTKIDHSKTRQGKLMSPDVFPLLKLPRELRDAIYNYTFQIEDSRSERTLRIERRNVKYFRPSPAAILLILRHSYFLLNRQVAKEALEVLFKYHSVFLSCGPFVLTALFKKIEDDALGRELLQRLNKIELAWITFPRLTHYPPEREDFRDLGYVEGDARHINDHIDFFDHENDYYDDNFYDPSDAILYPSWPLSQSITDANNLFRSTFTNQYPLPSALHSTAGPSAAEDTLSALDRLVQMEVTPLFTYLSSNTFSLTSITIPLHFSATVIQNALPDGSSLPLVTRYWVHVTVHALLMLTSTLLERVVVRYLPRDIWASMSPVDNLQRIVEKGVWFDEADAQAGGERYREGEAFRAMWNQLRAMGVWRDGERMGLQAAIEFVAWDGNLDSARIGDELEVVFSKRGLEVEM